MRAVLLENKDSPFRAYVGEAEAVAGADTVLDVEYSSLNYKDALALTNSSPVVRSWPMVAGIDGAGTVARSGNAELSPGDRAVITGWGLGETRWGCLADQVGVDADWPVKLPAGLSTKDAMAVGTAGLTAMLCVTALESHGVKPADGPVLVTGASGGVGGMALMFLKSLGFDTVASTGRVEQADYLKSLGASDVIDRNELSAAGKPLQKERWAGVVDSVGSHTLANACAQTRYGGIVAACGLAQGMDFPASLAPFILRGVTLAGIDSVMAPPARRKEAWEKVAQHLDRGAVEAMTRIIGLDEVFDAARDLLAGKVRGRLIVDVRK